MLTPCSECGAPKYFTQEHLWLNNGDIVQKRDQRHRLIFLESENLDPLFAGQLMEGGVGPMRGFPWADVELGYREGQCPVAEKIGGRIVCLEVYPTIEISDCGDVLAAIHKVTDAYLA